MKKDLQKWFDYGFIVLYLFTFCSSKQFSNFSLGHSISIDCDNHIPAVKNYQHLFFLRLPINIHLFGDFEVKSTHSKEPSVPYGLLNMGIVSVLCSCHCIALKCIKSLKNCLKTSNEGKHCRMRTMILFAIINIKMGICWQKHSNHNKIPYTSHRASLLYHCVRSCMHCVYVAMSSDD